MSVESERLQANAEYIDRLIKRIAELELELAEVRQQLIDELAKNALTPTGRDRLEKAEAELAAKDAKIEACEADWNNRPASCGDGCDVLIALNKENERLRSDEKTFHEAAQLFERQRDELREGLRKLMLEATGFLSMANPQTHGNTNIAVMQHWIDNAQALLGEGRGND